MSTISISEFLIFMGVFLSKVKSDKTDNFVLSIVRYYIIHSDFVAVVLNSSSAWE